MGVRRPLRRGRHGGPDACGARLRHRPPLRRAAPLGPSGGRAAVGGVLSPARWLADRRRADLAAPRVARRALRPPRAWLARARPHPPQPAPRPERRRLWRAAPLLPRDPPVRGLGRSAAARTSP